MQNTIILEQNSENLDENLFFKRSKDTKQYAEDFDKKKKQVQKNRQILFGRK